ncbi:lysoplasmalogenase [Bombina bombina]|uniref:lysoplasmalogenase n=1 Tax=Bombina bombina TaxID=8345 RepID=UPI00235A9C98|nr:lysoplasmalogenase [Bombina bombina]
MDILETDSRYKKTSLATVRSIIPKLLPFLATCSIYFGLWLPLSEPSWYSAFIKSLPILSLVFFVVIHSAGQGRLNSYRKKILLGLIFSAAGDISLIWEDSFLLGMIMFGLAHLMYTIAFGLRPLNIRVFIVLALFCATFYTVTLPYLNGPFVYMVGGYSALIGIMAWRALARVRMTHYVFSWAYFSAGLGSIFFMVSDCVLAVDKFCFPITNSRAIIMGTYYGAQMLITLSVAGSSEDEFRWKMQ